MALVAEGTISIDAVDLWAWISSQGIDAEDARGVRFDTDDQALVIEAKETHLVDAADLWAWITQKHLPEGMRGYESAFGVPRFNMVEMQISFAVSSVSDPRDWAVKPHCLSEWRNTASD